MAEPQIIGRIAVKVTPDTRSFRSTLKAQLEKIEKTIPPLKVKINVEVEDKGVAAQARALREKAKAELKDITLNVGADEESIRRAFDRLNRELDIINSRTISIKPNKGDITAWRDQFRDELDKLFDKMQNRVSEVMTVITEDLMVHPKFDRRAFQKEWQQMRDLVEQMETLRAKITPELDKASRVKIQREIDALQERIEDIKGRIHLELGPSYTWVGARLAWLARDRFTVIHPVVDQKAYAGAAQMLAALSGARLVRSVFDNLWDIVKNIDKNIPLIGGIALAIAGLSGWALSASSNLFALSASLAEIGLAGLALPGILAGFIVSIGTLITVLKDFNVVIPEAKEMLGQLQDQMSSAFWAEAEAPFRNFIDTIFPQFSQGILGTSEALGTFMGRFAEALAMELDGALPGMFANLNEAIRIATESTGGMASIIETLGTVGSEYLPRLAEGFNNVIGRWDSFLSQAAADGRLQGWIDLGIQRLGDLGSALWHAGGVLTGLANAAEKAGGSSLSMFADTLERLHAVVDSPGFQVGMVNAISAAHEAMNRIATISGPAVSEFFSTLSQTVTTVLPLAGTAIGTLVKGLAEALTQPAIQGGIESLFVGLTNAIAVLAPALTPLGTALGALMETIGVLAQTFAPILATIFTFIGEAVAMLAPHLQTLITALGPALNAILSALAPILLSIVAALGPLLTAIAGLVNILLPVLLPVITLVAEVIGSALTGAIQGLMLVFTGLGEVIAGAVALITAIFTGDWAAAWDAFKSIAEGVWNIVKGAFLLFINVGLVKVLRMGGGLLKGVWDNLWNGIKSFVTTIWNAIKSFIDNIWTNIKNGVQSTGTALRGVWDNLWNGIKSFVTGIWNGIKSFIDTTWKAIKTAVQTTGTALRSAWDSLWNGIKSFLSGIWDGMKGLVETAWNNLKGFVTDGLTNLRSAWDTAWNGVKTFLEDAWNKMVSTVQSKVLEAVAKVKELPGKAKDALSNIKNTLKDAGRKLIQGFIDGISGMFSSVKSTLGNLTSKLTEWKGPPRTDATILVGAGQLIVEGLIKGLESRYGDVRKSLEGLTSDIAGTDFESPAARRARVAGALARTGSSVIEDGIQVRQFIYNAAPNNSLSSEEELFAAVDRERMVGW